MGRGHDAAAAVEGLRVRLELQRGVERRRVGALERDTAGDVHDLAHRTRHRAGELEAGQRETSAAMVGVPALVSITPTKEVGSCVTPSAPPKTSIGADGRRGHGSEGHAGVERHRLVPLRLTETVGSGGRRHGFAGACAPSSGTPLVSKSPGTFTPPTTQNSSSPTFTGVPRPARLAILAPATLFTNENGGSWVVSPFFTVTGTAAMFCRSG